MEFIKIRWPLDRAPNRSESVPGIEIINSCIDRVIKMIRSYEVLPLLISLDRIRQFCVTHVTATPIADDLTYTLEPADAINYCTVKKYLLFAHAATVCANGESTARGGATHGAM